MRAKAASSPARVACSSKRVMRIISRKSGAAKGRSVVASAWASATEYFSSRALSRYRFTPTTSIYSVGSAGVDGVGSGATVGAVGRSVVSWGGARRPPGAGVGGGVPGPDGKGALVITAGGGGVMDPGEGVGRTTGAEEGGTVAWGRGVVAATGGRAGASASVKRSTAGAVATSFCLL